MLIQAVKKKKKKLSGFLALLCVSLSLFSWIRLKSLNVSQFKVDQIASSIQC